MSSGTVSRSDMASPSSERSLHRSIGGAPRQEFRARVDLEHIHGGISMRTMATKGSVMPRLSPSLLAPSEADWPSSYRGGADAELVVTTPRPNGAAADAGGRSTSDLRDS
jgi:hypothetical protein